MPDSRSITVTKITGGTVDVRHCTRPYLRRVVPDLHETFYLERLDATGNVVGEKVAYKDADIECENGDHHAERFSGRGYAEIVPIGYGDRARVEDR